MKLKVFCCPECRLRKFETINALNVHISKSHLVDYKIVMVENKPYRKRKIRGSVNYLKK